MAETSGRVTQQKVKRNNDDAHELDLETHGLDRASSPADTAGWLDPNNGQVSLEGVSGGEPSEDLQRKMMVFLYEQQSEQVLAFLTKMEAETKMKREHMFGGLSGCMALYLILGSMAQLLCNFTGFAYAAIESTAKDEDTQWLTYWTVFAIFSLVDFFADALMSVLPLYWLAKCVFLLYLYLPQFNGAEKLYQAFIKPAMLKYQEQRAARNAGGAGEQQSAPPPTAVVNQEEGGE